MKYFLFGILVVFGFTGVIESSYAGQASDVCSSRRVDAIVGEQYNNLPQSAEGQQLLALMDQRIKIGAVSESKAKQAVKKILEGNIRQGGGCPISEQLQKDVVKAYEDLAINGAKCTANQFVAKARRQYEQVRKAPDYSEFAQYVYQQIAAHVPKGKAQSALQKKWQSESGRKQIMIAAFDLGLRTENRCTDASLPISNLISSLTK